MKQFLITAVILLMAFPAGAATPPPPADWTPEAGRQVLETEGAKLETEGAELDQWGNDLETEAEEIEEAVEDNLAEEDALRGTRPPDAEERLRELRLEREELHARRLENMQAQEKYQRDREDWERRMKRYRERVAWIEEAGAAPHEFEETGRET